MVSGSLCFSWIHCFTFESDGSFSSRGSVNTKPCRLFDNNSSKVLSFQPILNHLVKGCFQSVGVISIGWFLPMGTG